jgi:hypothetical protein
MTLVAAVPRRDASFKKTVSAEDGRRSREETTLHIRKNRMAERMAKRRTAPMSNQSTAIDSNIDSAAHQPVPTTAKEIDIAIAGSVQTFRAWEANPASVNDDSLADATKAIRRLLSKERNPPVVQVIRSGIISFLVRFLQEDKTDAPRLQFESAWALTNIASTSRTSDVAHSGAIPHLVRIINHADSAELREQAAWCIGNVAGDSIENRDGLLATPMLTNGMLKNISRPANLSLLQNFTWAISNLCRFKPSPDFGAVAPFISALVNILNEVENGVGAESAVDLQTDTLWALSYLSDGDDARINAVLEAGVLKLLMNIFDNDSVPSNTLLPAVRVIGNCVSGSHAQTDAVIRAGFTERVGKLLHHPSKTVQKDACWAASNIAAGTEVQLNALLAAEPLNGIPKRIIEMAIYGNFDIRREAVYTISNILTTGQFHETKIMVQEDALKALSSSLELKQDSRMLIAAMEALETIFEYDAKFNQNYCVLFDEEKGIDKLEELQQHSIDEVYEKASAIITLYFGVEDEDDLDENMVPNENGDGELAFGFPKQLFPENQQSGAPTFDFSDVDTQGSPAILGQIQR